MKKSKKDFNVSIELTEGRYEFRYFIDNQAWDNDFEADGYIGAPYIGIENSVLFLDAVVVPAKVAKAKVEKTKVAATPKPAKATVKAKAVEKPAALASKAAPKAKPQAKKAAAPKAVVVDDLTKIEGVGPKIAQLLKDNGISTFDGLSKAKADAIKTILDKGGSRMQMHDPTTWPAQAKLAAKGSWDELNKLQDELKGGKKA
ncbi:MAG: hypothetical protein H6567_05980 [Lewinellaceae bacterium]|nr:hypothetical protein [Lewinellaceae bacterium]